MIASAAWLRPALWLASAASLAGCGHFSPTELVNPTQIHHTRRLPAGVSPTPLQQEAIDAASAVPVRYYEALKAAQQAPADAQKIEAYLREGIAVVQLYCLRWFARVADEQRNLQVAETNWNVITQLGTALIGVARLHSDVTTAYGALNTAVGGFNANLNNAFLIAPNAENVKRLTLEALGQRAALLTDSGSALRPQRFSDAYVQLEKLADVCTYQEVKRLTTESVDNSEPKVHPQTGTVKVVSAQVSSFVKTGAGDALRRFWKPNGEAIEAQNEATIKQWMAKAGISAPVTVFLRSDVFTSAREAAVKDLGLKTEP
ncbi:MAG: hypothetical protein AB1430_07030 [Pseudomonadota bacterium]